MNFFNEEIKSSLAVPMQYYDCNFPSTVLQIKKKTHDDINVC